MLLIRPLDIPDLPTLLAIIGGISGIAVGIGQLIKMFKDAQNADKRLPSQTKLDESEYARNATETANLATKARLELEEHTRVLEQKIDKLADGIAMCKASIGKLNKKNKQYVRIIRELLIGIKILVGQLEDQQIKPAWVPNKSVEILVESIPEDDEEE